MIEQWLFPEHMYVNWQESDKENDWYRAIANQAHDEHVTIEWPRMYIGLGVGAAGACVRIEGGLAAVGSLATVLHPALFVATNTRITTIEGWDTSGFNALFALALPDKYSHLMNPALDEIMTALGGAHNRLQSLSSAKDPQMLINLITSALHAQQDLEAILHPPHPADHPELW